MADTIRKKKNTEEAESQPKNEPSKERTAENGKISSSTDSMQKRQSGPKPTAQDELTRMQQKANINALLGESQGIDGNGALNGFRAVEAPIGKEAIHKAVLTLQKYKEGKANLERKIVENEQWYKLRHWECMRKNGGQLMPTSAWLFNAIANKHASAMENFPSPNILPREEGDQAEAEMLSSIIPVILDQNDFEKTYDDVAGYRLRTGTGVYGIFWDKSKLNGLGDISIQKVDLINLFWEPGITDIQRSRNLFHVTLEDNENIESMYPQLRNRLGSATIDIAKYVYDDTVDTSEKSVVVDWYYKRMNQQGKQILHYCKFCNDEVLFSTENTPEFAERGLYDHGRYPYEFDPLFRMEGTPAGFGYIDIGKSAQEYIDRGNQAIMENMLSNARPRYFIRNDGSVNEEEYGDMSKDFVHVDGNLGQDSVLPVTGKALSDIYVEVINNKIDELKEVTGNRDISTGGTSSGVTAASAIAAMQEAGSALSRHDNKQTYRVFRQICLDVIELIRQFYDLPRCFRIMGANGVARYVQYSNAGIVPQAQGMDFGIDMGMRIPLFDIEVSAQKQSPYSKMSQNELALQFYSAGFFNPQMADQALACIDMMDFDRKEFVRDKIQQNGGMLQQMMMLATLLDQQTGGNQFATSLAQQYGIQLPASEEAPTAEDKDALGGDMGDAGESNITKNARQRVADSTEPV